MFKKLYYSLPIQLLILNIKRQHFYLMLWAILWAMISGNFGKKFGINFLFLDPEYLGEVGFLSFLVMGAALGAFLVSYNIASYIIYGKEFPFLGGLRKPFLKFSLNNSIIPLTFIGLYIYQIYSFQTLSENLDASSVLVCISGVLLGCFTFAFLSFTYFFNTNKDIMKILGMKVKHKVKRAFVMQRKRLDKQFNWQNSDQMESDIKVKYYLETNFKLEPVGFATNYDFKVLQSVMRQNHQNAVFIQLTVLLLLLVLGLLRDMPFFQIPAGASVFVLFSMLVMLSGAFSFWMKGWGISVFIALMIFYNVLSQNNLFNYRNEAYGLVYNKERVKYNQATIDSLNSDSLYLSDYNHGIDILNNWKEKAHRENRFQKPKMIFVNASGGGQRAALFTLNTLQYVDSALGGKMMQNTVLCTGASGGALSLALFRELTRLKIHNPDLDIYNKIYREQIAKDLLNPIIFSIVVNDLFFPFQRIKVGNQTYRKDRGYAFEKGLNENLNFLLDKPISQYDEYEASAELPMLLLSPTIINDGRKLYISGQPMSYLTHNLGEDKKRLAPRGGIEFSRFFKNQNSDSLLLTSALRMNANFPYISPNTSLPSEPLMEVIDAGMRDNTGKESAMRFAYVFKDWIEKNTSGIIFLQIRDTPRFEEVNQKTPTSSLSKIARPLYGFYGNWEKFQQYNQSEAYQYLSSSLKVPIETISFEYIPQDDKHEVSLSWHLTSKEKVRVQEAIYQIQNQKSLRKLTNRLEH
ncbi:MAG: hypothetical protein ACI81S_000682 [Sphingobacteriales bacterium]|jgi:hypothetical protein